MTKNLVLATALASVLAAYSAGGGESTTAASIVTDSIIVANEDGGASLLKTSIDEKLANETPDGPIFTQTAGDTLALSGYDAVAYFTDAGPTEGSADHMVTYQGFEYRFASAENAATFAADPARFAPQYGGYCAWAIGANNALAPGDPEIYKIVDGKLYLNFNDDVSKLWHKDIPGFIAKGDVNYPTHDPSEHYTTN